MTTSTRVTVAALANRASYTDDSVSIDSTLPGVVSSGFPVALECDLVIQVSYRSDGRPDTVRVRANERPPSGAPMSLLDEAEDIAGKRFGSLIYVCELRPLVLEGPGQYVFEIHLNDELASEVDLIVEQMMAVARA